MTLGRSPNLTGQGPHLLQGHNTLASPGCCEGPAQSKRVTSQQPLSLSPPSSCPPPPADAEVCFVTSLEQPMLTGQTRTWFQTGHCLASCSFPPSRSPSFQRGARLHLEPRSRESCSSKEQGTHSPADGGSGRPGVGDVTAGSGQPPPGKPLSPMRAGLLSHPQHSHSSS